MADDGLHYDAMVEGALRGVVRDALRHAAERGLPGDHHFYITFRTAHPEVDIPEHLRLRYPNEMTIVLQHQYWDLEVGPERFGVTLSFSDVPEHLSVPFDAVIAFADPSVRFGLQFEARERSPKQEDTGKSAQKEKRETPLLRQGSAGPALRSVPQGREAGSGAAPEGEADAAEAGKVVPLDTFRKK